jgi:hypothetical protein
MEKNNLLTQHIHPAFDDCLWIASGMHLLGIVKGVTSWLQK